VKLRRNPTNLSWLVLHILVSSVSKASYVFYFVLLAVVPVDGISSATPAVESEIAAAIREYIRSEPQLERLHVEEFAQMRSQQCHLVGVGRRGMRLYWWCQTRRALCCLLDYVDTGRLLQAITRFFRVVTDRQERELPTLYYLTIAENIPSDIVYSSRMKGALYFLIIWF